MRCRDCFDEYAAQNKNTKERVTLLKVKSASDADLIHSRFPILEQCNSEFLVKYEGEIQEDDTLWVVTGENLHIGKLSLDGGELHVDGRIDAISFEDAPASRGGFLSRLLGG